MPIILYFTHQKAPRGHPENFPQFYEGPLDLFFIVYSAHSEKHKTCRIARYIVNYTSKWGPRGGNKRQVRDWALPGHIRGELTHAYPRQERRYPPAPGSHDDHDENGPARVRYDCIDCICALGVI